MGVPPAMNKIIPSALALAALLSAACTQTERDGRSYHSSAMPLQGRMGVTFKHVPAAVTATADAPATTKGEGAAATAAASPRADSPPGLLDPYIKVPVDEPGAEYWMHARQSPDPIQGKMGVRVKRIKKS
jgi:hypothetical protein